MDEEKKDIVSFQDIMPLCEIFVKSGIFEDTKDVAQAIVKVLAGREIGLSPLQSMMNLYIVKNRVVPNAQIISALIKKSKTYDYKILKLDNEECSIEFFKRDEKNAENSLGISSFTVKDAARAGVINGTNWKGYPRNMLYARAITNGARWFCPDSTMGAGTSIEELESVANNNTVISTVSMTPEGEVTNGKENKKSV